MKTKLPISVLIVAMPVLQAQAPAFEVTSVKQRPSTGQRQVDLDCSSSGRFVSKGVPLGRLIIWAFKMAPFQVTGLPPWTNSTDAIFEIEATAAAPVSEDQCKLMVQTLLADRFKLAVRRSTQEIPAYALVVAKNGTAKNGAKMRQVNPDDKPKPGGGVRIMGNPVQGLPGREPYRGWSMAQLVDFLMGQPALDGRPVVDRTGLDGIYEIDLDYAFRKGFAGDKPEIFDAVQEQLGLKLDSVKAPFEMMVVDRLEKPDAN
jgi:uncharacterized protein (TIGR03435 family)